MTDTIASRASKTAAILGLVALGTASLAFAQAPLGTEFTYQGKLNDQDIPANAAYDFHFLLFDAASGGNQVGSSVVLDDWPVTDGLFTVPLDFPGAFNGDARWLEVQVREGASGGTYTTLSPRHPLTAAPYALYALNSPGGSGYWQGVGSAITNTNSGFVGINRSNPVTAAEYFGIQAPATGTSYGGMYIRTDSDTAKPFYGYSTNAHTAWTYLDGQTGDWHVYN
ncbi:MAG: hypothetical protein KC729_21775, partial [Candidatus Eisenbacteria bacterium]|nr:hypothetical protein [Candidatus Eisenbacteria bacterium]